MDLCQRLGELVDATTIREVLRGHQSRVFEASATDGRPFVVKVVNSSLVDPGEARTRIEVTAELAELTPSVCRPLPIAGRLLTTLENDAGPPLLISCYECAGGRDLIPSDADDARLMGEALAQLHISMAGLKPSDLPLVAALRTRPVGIAGPHQLLHGDFNSTNLRQLGGAIRIFDFDDCGYGPPSFDVANSLYMVLFDDMTQGGSSFRGFTDAFLSGYGSATEANLDRDEIGRLIDLRVNALEFWLDHPETAPVGIRTSSAEWHTTLRAFVASHRGG